jgi:predicted O-methyltransferase YrrM
MDILKIKPIIEEKLKKSLIPARILLDKFRLIEESSRKTSAYTDPLYVPFYFYMGRLVEAKNVVEIGFRLGLLSGCFLKGCQTAKSFLGFQEESEEFYSARLAKANIRDNFKGEFDFYYGQISDPNFLTKLEGRGWDVIIINEEKNYDEHRSYLDIMWEYLNNDGLIIMDYLDNEKHIKQAYLDFCKIKNRDPIIFKTRYGTGMIQK